MRDDILPKYRFFSNLFVSLCIFMYNVYERRNKL